MQARRAVVDWAQGHVADRAVLSDIALAVTEAATNAVLHAYRDRAEPGTRGRSRSSAMATTCASTSATRAAGSPRASTVPGLGLGLGLIAQVADSADVRAPESGGTEVVMRFSVEREAA